MGGCKAPITTFIVEPFVPHDQEYYLSIVSERLGSTISFSECGGIEIEENWDKVKTIFLPTEKPMTPDSCAPLIATLPLEVLDAFLRSSNLNTSILSHFSHWRYSFCLLIRHAEKLVTSLKECLLSSKVPQIWEMFICQM